MAAAEVDRAGLPLELTGDSLREGLERALERLLEERDRINELNVFPVPDGDTGSNMHLTLEAACQAVAELPPDAGLAAVAAAAAHGALMGARGNSGVILSQVLRGFSAECQGQDSLDPERLCQALEEASRVAHLAVKRPVEGTILSVLRDAAAAARRSLGADSDLERVLGAMAAEAWSSVERSQGQMEVLRQAGVVDAGGFGLAVVLASLAELAAVPPALRLPPAITAPTVAVRGAAAAAAPVEGFGYCTEFTLVGAELEPLELRGRLANEAEDDSALVVGEPGLAHVHVHTPEPWVVLARAAAMGRIERLKVEDMTLQHRQARERAGPAPGRSASPQPLGVVAVAQGAGFSELFRGLGAAAVLEGGQGMNPSTEELLQAMAEAGASQLLLLPNNPNLVLGAEQAARVAPGQAVVVPSRNLPQGIAALLAFDPESPLEVNRRRMERALTGVHAIEVATAVRDSRIGGRPVESGQLVGLLDGRLVSAGQAVEEVVLAALGQLAEEPVEVVTVYRGAGVGVQQAEALGRAVRERFPALEVEIHEGGQPLYPFILSAE